MIRGRKGLLACGMAAALTLPAAAQATTYVVPAGPAVVNPADGVCSLQEASLAAFSDIAINECPQGSGDDTILLSGGLYTLVVPLNPGDPTPGDTTTIARAGSVPATLKQTSNERVILVNNGAVFIDGVTVTGGHLPLKAFGGGIDVTGASLALSNSLVTGNALVSTGPNNEGDGGGIAGGAGASVQLTNVTVSGNAATGNGGGIDTTNSAQFTLDNVTVTGNRADSDGLNGGVGGGINRPTVTPMPLTIRNSIIAGNHDSGQVVTAPDCRGFDVGPTLPALASNVIGDATGCGYAPGPGDRVGADPLLGPLADNGGPTLTHALLAGSPALDAALAPCPATDQRGITRPQGAGCDVGAFELEVAPPEPAAPAAALPGKRKCKRKKRKHHHAAAAKKRCKKKHKRR